MKLNWALVRQTARGGWRHLGGDGENSWAIVVDKGEASRQVELELAWAGGRRLRPMSKPKPQSRVTSFGRRLEPGERDRSGLGVWGDGSPTWKVQEGSETRTWKGVQHRWWL